MTHFTFMESLVCKQIPLIISGEGAAYCGVRRGGGGGGFRGNTLERRGRTKGRTGSVSSQRRAWLTAQIAGLFLSRPSDSGCIIGGVIKNRTSGDHFGDCAGLSPPSPSHLPPPLDKMELVRPASIAIVARQLNAKFWIQDNSVFQALKVQSKVLKIGPRGEGSEGELIHTVKTKRMARSCVAWRLVMLFTLAGRGHWRIVFFHNHIANLFIYILFYGNVLWKSSWKIIYQKLSESVSKRTLTGPQPRQLLAWALLVSRLLRLTFFLHLRNQRQRLWLSWSGDLRERGSCWFLSLYIFFSLSRRSYSLCRVFSCTQPCNMMFGTSIEGRCGLRFEALSLFHRWFIPSASKESESKSKIHNWIYITHLDEIFIFWLLIKNAGLLQMYPWLSVCVLISTLPAAVLVDAW